ncbi:MAG: nitrilase-related carbon-nitrogen hydrolase [Christensenellales bacterium]|jgi:predicted amidohydrolase
MARWITIASLPGAQLLVQDANDHEANVQAEMAYWNAQIKKVLPDKPDLIVTPECCDRPAGLSGEQKVAYYRARGDRMRDFFMQQAIQHHTNIAYGAMRVLPDGTCRNSIQFINRQGGIDGIYNKNMLVIEEYTQQNALYGAQVQAIQTDFGRVTGCICFDLNFEQPLQDTVRAQPELIVFASAYHGGIMQQHWAYMARAYFVSCVFGTRTASIINPVGEVIAQSSNYYPYLTAKINLDYQVVHLDHNWEKLQAMKEAYGDSVSLCTPYGLGCVLLTNHGQGSMADIVRQFDMETWDQYYARSVAARHLPGRLETI